MATPVKKPVLGADIIKAETDKISAKLQKAVAKAKPTTKVELKTALDAAIKTL